MRMPITLSCSSRVWRASWVSPSCSRASLVASNSSRNWSSIDWVITSSPTRSIRLSILSIDTRTELDSAPALARRAGGGGIGDGGLGRRRRRRRRHHMQRLDRQVALVLDPVEHALDRLAGHLPAQLHGPADVALARRPAHPAPAACPARPTTFSSPSCLQFAQQAQRIVAARSHARMRTEPDLPGIGMIAAATGGGGRWPVPRAPSSAASSAFSRLGGLVVQRLAGLRPREHAAQAVHRAQQQLDDRACRSHGGRRAPRRAATRPRG